MTTNAGNEPAGGRGPNVLDLAAGADRDALFAAVQAAVIVITSLADSAGRVGQMPEFEAPIRRALELGAPLLSAADLADRDAGGSTGHDRVAAALRQPAGRVW